MNGRRTALWAFDPYVKAIAFIFLLYFKVVCKFQKTANVCFVPVPFF